VKSKILSILSGIALAMNLGLVQAAESDQTADSVQATDEANVATTQAENLPQEMPGILAEITSEEITVMTSQEMETSVGSGCYVDCRWHYWSIIPICRCM
jgi:hypothetical protein